MPKSTPSRERIAEAIKRAEAEDVNVYNMHFAGCQIDGPFFRIDKMTYPITDVTAEYEVGAHTTSSRTTVTRLVAGHMIAGTGGMIAGGAAKKVTDNSKVFLTVRTPDGQVHLKDAPTSDDAQGRQFMANLEMATKREWPITTKLGTTLPLDESSVREEETSVVVMMAGLVFVLLIVAVSFSSAVRHNLGPIFLVYFCVFVGYPFIRAFYRIGRAKTDRQCIEIVRASPGEYLN
ncbi:hypothetical protein [Prescottella agglutinans]|uniref:Positive regulator of sigma E activity n=1 Tax=Prescottella agglutinans TaxID=1644129 RepID=A0ABT6M6I0_9NOCA|nr:hypothetical protein [Prescottella agglutinans]MDH6279366.1 positive regulator of sigma E activity [Prescottella agglutinans]